MLEMCYISIIMEILIIIELDYLYSLSKSLVILVPRAFAISSNSYSVGEVFPFSILFSVLLLKPVSLASSINVMFLSCLACQVLTCTPALSFIYMYILYPRAGKLYNIIKGCRLWGASDNLCVLVE